MTPNHEFERRIRELEREVMRLAQTMGTRQRMLNAGSLPSVYTLVIGGGNTLSDGTTLGIKNAPSAITTVPSIYNPALSPACIDGIGYATLYINNASQGAVMVCNYNGDGSPYQLALSANQITLTSLATISIPLAGDATQSITCYVPYSP